MSTDNIIQNISGALSLLADRTSAILQRNDSPALNADEIVEECVHKLRFYLPVDFGNTENNEYMDYLAQSCCENYRNGKYQFSLMAYHMLFMAVLYKEFWGLKCFSNERVAALCRRNGTYNAIEQVFDASPIPEKSFIDDFFGVFSWHPNRKSTYKEYVDKRDRCAHNSGFVQYGKEDVESYFADVLRNIERVSQACEESLVEVYSNTLKRYLESPSFESTTTIDFISRELSEKKYSYRDLSKLLAAGRPEGMDSLSYTLSFCFSRLFLSLTVENAGYSPENGSDDLIEELCSFWRSLTPEDQETLSLQLEYEIEMLDEKGYSISELRKLIENTDEQQ